MNSVQRKWFFYTLQQHISYGDKKAFTTDLKNIYRAPNKQAVRAALEDFAERWESKYGYVVKSWLDNW